MTIIYLARHGETEWNLQGRFQGHTDSLLTPRGLAQAEQLARALASVPLDAVFSSDLARALRTAEAVAARHRLEVRTHAGLREVDTGAWTGLDRGGVTTRWPEGLERYRTRPASLRFPDGETLAEVQERALAALEQLLEPLPGKRAVVITHGTLLEAVLAHAMGLGLDALWLRLAHHCRPHVLEYAHGRLRVVELGTEPKPSDGAADPAAMGETST